MSDSYEVKCVSDFETARAKSRVFTQRGSKYAVVCGAKIRNGNYCRGIPIKGSSRCIRHCGPKAANERFERLRKKMLKGKISYDEFSKVEKRRALNKLRDQWKKDPWSLGATIDLQEHEEAFQQSLGHYRAQLSDVAPAVQDWLRWRYQRLMVDRFDIANWTNVLMHDLPTRLSKIGPRPAQSISNGPGAHSPQPWRASSQKGRRRIADAPREAKQTKERSLRTRGHPRKEKAMTADEVYDEFKFIRDYQLAPLLAVCTDQLEMDEVIHARRKYAGDPNNRAYQKHWYKIATTLPKRDGFIPRR